MGGKCNALKCREGHINVEYVLVTFKLSEYFAITGVEKRQTYQFLYIHLKYKSGHGWTDIILFWFN